jgi:xylan 1,4-beta-xylosidase
MDRKSRLLFALTASLFLAFQFSEGADVAHDWARGIEGQRKADLGNGTYLNPIFPGDHPDPSILKDGSDYYIVFSTFEHYPGLVLWHSRDLVNWQPIGPTLFQNVGAVWAPELVKHEGRYYIYFPASGTNYVIWADNIRGPWSAPVELKIREFDPGHAVGPDGRRYLFVESGKRVELAPDGLSAIGEPVKVYDGWRFPEDWIVAGFGLEAPKIMRRGEYYHKIVAQGGTAGPPTSHMVVSARSKSIDGPWENSPYNPIVRTTSRDEKWWSRGHGTLVEGPDAQWYLVYHAYENGFYNLGRNTLLEPVEWTDDGWFKSRGDDVAQPIKKPTGGEAVPHGFALSDDFSTNKMGLQWSFYNGTEADMKRFRYADRGLVVQGKGTSPRDSSPLAFVVGDHAYEIQVELEFRGEDARGGLILFYNDKLYAGIGLSRTHLIMHREGFDRPWWPKPADIGDRVFIRLRNDRHIVTIHTSTDGKTWKRFQAGMEVSGYHHNVVYGFLSLRPALYAAGEGEVVFRNFQYRALP